MNIVSHSYDELKTYYDNVLNKNLLKCGNINDVPTPIGCIEEILRQIPERVWADPNLTIFDPCCGNGNWHLVVWNLINQHLQNHHHLDHSLIMKRFFFNDVKRECLATVSDMFALDYKDNLSCTDFLSSFVPPPQAPKFDIIMANPPYAHLMHDGKRSAKNHNLIGAFIEKALLHLKDDGFLIFLVPDSWMSLSDRNIKYVEMLTKNCTFLHLNVHSARKWFQKVGSTFTWFIVQKTLPVQQREGTTVEGMHMGFRFSCKCSLASQNARQYLPLVITPDVLSILEKTLENNTYPRFCIETSSDLHKHTKRHLLSDEQNENQSHPYKVIHTFRKTIYSSRAHKFQEGYKVFISLTNNYATMIDDCGMTQSVAFVRCEDLAEAAAIKSMLDHDLYLFLNNICRWGNFNNIRILQKFPKPSSQIDFDIFDFFKITEKEKQFIKAFLKREKEQKLQ
jgi:methylase of polypeptide subunit release factors